MILIFTEQIIKKKLHVEKTLTKIRAYRNFFVMIWDGFELEKSL